MRRFAKMLFALAASLLALGMVVPVVWAHGGNEMETQDLQQQPARTLAQQALAELRVRHDMEAAASRLDAAVESKDQSDVDPQMVNQAMETLDAGDEAQAVTLLDHALSQPLGESSGAALHESGREFQPGTGTQEVVAIILGAVLLLLAGLLLLRNRRASARSA
jgi:LPXTG-motif cell wall-anchored protein